MFTRFRQTQSRLQISLIETRRVDGKVRHEHVASLGSIILSPSVADRIAFWTRLHERLAKLSNRIVPEMQGKILGDIHARVPMVTPDEQRALQLENARTDAERWSALRDISASKVVGKQQLVTKVEAQIVADKAAAAAADDVVKNAQGRVEAIQRGEVVEGGLGRPEDFVAFMKKLGWSKADLRHARWMATAIPKEHFKEFVEAVVDLQRKNDRRFSRQALRTVLRKHGEGT